VASETHTPTKICVARENALTVTKKSPEHFTVPELLQVLPQLEGSCDPGGVGVSGDGARRPGCPASSNLKFIATSAYVASVVF
jgi:hypothetical protein